MNHRKRKQSENLKKSRKVTYNPFVNDPLNSKCPYCGKIKKICSHIDSLSRAWGRKACANKHNHIKKDN